MLIDVAVNDLQMQVTEGSCPPSKLQFSGAIDLDMRLPMENLCIYGFALTAEVRSSANPSSTSSYLGNVSLNLFNAASSPSCQSPDLALQIRFDMGGIIAQPRAKNENIDENIFNPIDFTNLVTFLSNTPESITYQHLKAHEILCKLSSQNGEESPSISSSREHHSLEVLLSGRVTFQVSLGHDMVKMFYLRDIPFNQIVQLTMK